MQLIWIKYHLIALLAGILLDLIIGDPEHFPHPVRWMGRMIADYEERWNNGELTDEERFQRGRRMVISVILLTAVYSAVILAAGYYIHPVLGMCIEAVISAYMLAARSLSKESEMVRTALERGTLEDGRNAVARIVGRDTAELSEKGVIKAAVETVAENTSDGVIAPLLYLLAGGPVLGCIYKAVNTMDSMVGYKNEKYLWFGRAAARLDDAANYIPARITAVLIVISACILRGCSGRRAAVICRRDAGKSTSPNSGHPEAAVAGALGIELLGNASYHGIPVCKPTIGDPLRDIERKDISRANSLMFTAEGIAILPVIAALIFIM